VIPVQHNPKHTTTNMNTQLRQLFLVLALLVSSATTYAADKLKVVATIPDLADIVRQIGGDRVEVTTICKGLENAHLVTPKPSHLVAMSRADVLVQVGLSLETAFVPGLLEGAQNDKIQPGKPGFVNTSEGWQPLDVPKVLDRKFGDVHPQGNPHMNMSPKGGRQMAERVLAGLIAVDPGSKDGYETRFAEYSKKLEEAEKRWSEMEKPWAGRKVIVYHKEYDYLIEACGLKLVGSIEPKPGSAPTASSLAELIDTIKREKDVTIFTAPWSNNQAVARIVDESGSKVVELPNMCGGIPGTESWIGMMDLVHQRLSKVFGSGQAR
jgi:zinc/manganese transport system substrate-binding protein